MLEELQQQPDRQFELSRSKELLTTTGLACAGPTAAAQHRVRRAALDAQGRLGMMSVQCVITPSSRSTGQVTGS